MDIAIANLRIEDKKNAASLEYCFRRKSLQIDFILGIVRQYLD